MTTCGMCFFMFIVIIRSFFLFLFSQSSVRVVLSLFDQFLYFSHDLFFSNILGTPAFAAPEVLRKQTYSYAADVYSFAIVLSEIWERSNPYQGCVIY